MTQLPHTNQYKSLFEEFTKREVEFGLFDLTTTDGIAYWDLVRDNVFMNILRKAAIMPEMPYTPIQIHTYGTLKSRLKAIALIPLNWYHAITRKKQDGRVLTLNISRNWSEEKQQFTDLLFADIHQELQENVFQVEAFTYYRKEILKWSNRNKRFLIGLEIRSLWRKPDYSEPIESINYFDDLLPADFMLESYIRNELFNYRQGFAFYTSLLQKHRIRHVILQASPKCLIAAANTLHIPVYDLQHGHFNEFNSYYNYDLKFDSSKCITIVPKLLTVSNYWNQFVHPTIKPVTIGSTYFFPSQRSAELRHILIIGSRFTHDDMLHELKICAQALPQEHFIYKLHSNQGDQLESTVDFFEAFPNVEICIFNDINTLLTEAKWLILVQSTVAYQALQMGIPVCVYKKYYYEASEDLLGRQDVVLVNSLSEFPAYFTKGITPNPESINYFERFSPNILHNLIQ